MCKEWIPPLGVSVKFWYPPSETLLETGTPPVKQKNHPPFSRNSEQSLTLMTNFPHILTGGPNEQGAWGPLCPFVNSALVPLLYHVIWSVPGVRTVPRPLLGF